jgi:hypothetical protein
MKQLISLGVLLISVLLSSAQPKIEFKKTEHDYGTIKEDGGMATATFEFKNTGNQPLILNSVKATCGCTTPEWSKEPVAPGKSGFVKVAYNPINRPGAFQKNANVYTNAEPSVSILTIKGKVEPRKLSMEEQYPREMGPLRCKSNYLSLGTMKNTESKTETLEFYNSSDKEATLKVYRAPAHMQIAFEPQTIPPGKTGLMSVVYDAKKRNAYGYVSDRIYLEVNGQKENSFSVGTSVSINEDFSSLTEEQKQNAPVALVENNIHDFGSIRNGAISSFSYKLKNEGKSDLIIRSVKASCGCTAVKNENVVKPGLTTEIKVDFNSKGKRGRQNKSVTVITNDPQNPTLVLRIMGDVVN